MEAHAATVIDDLVSRIGHNRTDTADRLFAEAAKDHVFHRLHELGAPEFLRALRASPEGDLFASALLRLLSHRHASIDDSALRAQIVEFLDGQYASRLQPYYKPPRKKNAYEVLNALAPVISTMERRADEVVESFGNLDRLELQRQNLMKLLNAPSGQVIFKPFLPSGVIETDMPKLFAAAVTLRDAESRDDVGVAYNRLTEAAADVEKAIDAYPTLYARRILLGTAERIQKGCRQRLELSSPPARLDIRAGDRPLPLLEPGVTTSFDLHVVNDGEASARDLELLLTPLHDEITVADGQKRLGLLEPKRREDIQATVVVNEPCVSARVEIHARWTNPDHTVGESHHSADLSAQETHIDWESLTTAAPYSPYPVEDAARLVGRERQLESLKNQFRSRPLANLYLTGQRRIGKTSLVRVLSRELAGTRDLIVSSVEMGEARGVAGVTTIGTLGRKLAERAVKAAGLNGEVEIPDFADSLAPLTDVVDAIQEWDDGLSFLFIIDEFDELPHETYRRDGPGDALFVPMRSLAQKPNVGWLLVGGERMPFIRDEQAARLNTFNEMSLDHLALGDPAGRGFGDLIRTPLPSGFFVDDAAVRKLFDESAGNPHFAKEICSVLFDQATSRRDAFVSPREVESAVTTAARIRDVELFAHFWEDGIFERDEQRSRRELQRRAYLTACAEALRTSGGLHHNRIRQAAESRDLSSSDIERLRTEFIRRGILGDNEGGGMTVSVPFFRRWLEAEGIYKLPPKGIAEQAQQEVAAADRELRVSASEVGRLTKQWAEFRYRGQPITRDSVESWLDQFETPLERRIAFRMLERLRPITDGEIFDGFRRLQRLVARESKVELKRGQRVLNHLYVSGLGHGGSSGHSFAYIYRQANNINQNNAVEIGHLIERLLKRPTINTVVFVDDFIGSGGSAIKALRPIADRIGELTARPPVHWFLFAVAGLPAGANAIGESDEGRKLGIRVELAEAITPADMPFGPKSTVFPKGDEQVQAREVIQKYGERIGNRWPLGYRKQAAPIVFPQNCPNNAPAVLWADGEGWQPLFRRTGQ